MASKNRRRGFGYERELVALARERHLSAKRAYASDGRALGESEKVDVKVESFRIQAKRRKKLPAYLHLDDGVDGVAFRCDRGKTMVLIEYSSASTRNSRSVQAKRNTRSTP